MIDSVKSNRKVYWKVVTQMMITLLKKEILLNKVFPPNKKLILQRVQKNSKVQTEITQSIDKYNNEAYSTESKIGQKALIQRKVFEQAINTMGDTNEDMDYEVEQKDNKLENL